MRHSFIALAAMAVLVGCTGKKAKDTFVYCSEGSPSLFNPILATDGTSYDASSRPIFNRLVDFKPGTTEVIPSLATEWEVSQDGKVYTFKLRKGVSFHATADFAPTREFNADDVIFTFARPHDKDNPYNKISGGNYVYFNAMKMGELIKEIKKINDHEVQFVLTQPEAPFLANLAMDFASIHSKEYADKMLEVGTPERVDTNPVGTGPFVFKSYVKDTAIRFEANKTYFAGAPQINKLVFLITPDPSVRFQKLKAGECDFINEPSPTDLNAIKDDPNIKLVSTSGLNVGYLSMNVQKKPFDNVKVRQAINFALNRESYIDAIYYGNAEVAKNPIPPSMWSYNNEVPGYPYDVEKAKQLLKEAGYADGFETELWALPVSRPYNPNGKKMAELMQADLAKVGVKVKIVTYDWPTYLAKSEKLEHEMLQLGWNGDNGDPDNFLDHLLGCDGVKYGSNNAGWCYKPFDALVKEAKRVTTQAEREALYKKSQQIVFEQAPWVPLAHSTVYRAMRANVSGYTLSPLATNNFDQVVLK